MQRRYVIDTSIILQGFPEIFVRIIFTPFQEEHAIPSLCQISKEEDTVYDSTISLRSGL